jgi:hypothetical protein
MPNGRPALLRPLCYDVTTPFGYGSIPSETDSLMCNSALIAMTSPQYAYAMLQENKPNLDPPGGVTTSGCEAPVAYIWWFRTYALLRWL